MSNGRLVGRTLMLVVPVACVTLLINALWLGDLSPLPGRPYALPLWAIVVGFILSELIAVDIESRSQAHSVNFVELMYVPALLLGGPTTVVVGRVLAMAIRMGILRRQAMHKLVVNVVCSGAEATVATFVFYGLLEGRVPVAPGAWPIIYLSTGSAFLVGAALITAAITILSGFPGRRMITQVVIIGGAVCLANTTLGIVVLGAIWNHSYSGLLVIGVVAVLFALYRAHTRLTERHKSLETLHDFTRTLDGSLELESLELAIVEGARDILRGEHCALVVKDAGHPAGATRVLLRGEGSSRGHISFDALETDLRLLVPGATPRLYQPGQPLPGWLGELGVKDAAIVPLVDEGATVGAMVVANRLTEVSTFVDEDLRLFETLANHANVALANGRLVATLQQDAQAKAYQALHDPVTDLPNRTSLEETLKEALVDAHRTEQRVGLVFVDLDTFKEVNDTLGIATGDQVLREVRDRLAPLLPDRSALTRFTGDQFAIMVQGVREVEEVEGLAELVDAAFDQPFVTGEASIVMAASIGVALYPDHATTPDLLVQRADAATYLARKEGSGIEVYAPETDPQSQRRMSLAADLRTALENGEVDVYVQPKLSLSDSQVVGAEALVRWTHPRLGPLVPDEFIGAAEQTGVIRPLTHYVLREALAQCRAWRDAGLDLGISVNLSVKNLFEPRLADDIGAAIEAAGVPASCLTLEITESTVMESKRSIEVLGALDALGLKLSIDDFGTGYSSLTYLRKLPVQELKIDKSFVMTMTSNEQDAVIVRTLVELGRSLGLKTVAEGVESPEAVRMLEEYGCVEAQGYFFSRPVPAEQFTAWLARQQVRKLDTGVVSFSRERERRASGDSSQA